MLRSKETPGMRPRRSLRSTLSDAAFCDKHLGILKMFRSLLPSSDQTWLAGKYTIYRFSSVIPIEPPILSGFPVARFDYRSVCLTNTT